jgi:hypothetical protein
MILLEIQSMNSIRFGRTTVFIPLGKASGRRVAPVRGVSNLSRRVAHFPHTKMWVAQELAAVIEIPHDAIVERLLEHGFAVFSINPKQFDRFRDRNSLAGAKDNRRDAFVLADALRTDQHCFRSMQLDEPEMIRLVLRPYEFGNLSWIGADEDVRATAGQEAGATLR